MRADNLINGWYNSTGVTATTDYNENVTTTSWTRPIALNQQYKYDIQGLQAASSNYPIVSCRGPFSTASCPNQPSCSLTVNGTGVTSSTQAPINVCETSTVSISATSATGALNTGIYYALDNATAGTTGINPAGVSATYSWVTPNITTTTAYNVMCNSRNAVNVSCTGNPFYAYSTTGATGFMDCGVRDTVQVNVLPTGLAPGAACTLACQCASGACGAGTCDCTSDAQCGGTLGCNLSTGLCQTKPSCNQACTTGGVACTQVSGLPAGQTIGCSSNLCRNQTCPAEADCVCPATITGTLFDATNFTCSQSASAPKIAGVTASAVSGANTYTSAGSDVAGKYTISNVPVPGTYTISANAIGLDGLGYQVSPKLLCTNSTSTLTLTTADSAQTRTFDLGFWKSIPSWFQVMGGNILAEQVISPSIRSTVPACPTGTTCTVPRSILARKNLETTDPFAGYPVVGQSGASQGNVVSVTGSTNMYANLRQSTSTVGQTFSERGRTATVTPTKNYAYFWQLYSMGATLPPTSTNTDISSYASNLSSYPFSTSTSARGAYYVKSTTGTVTIANTLAVGSNQKIVIFVDGNLTVNVPITVSEGGFLAFIVKGNVTFANTLVAIDGVTSTTGLAEGVYLADGSIIVQSNGASGSDPNDGKFVGKGVFVGWGGVSLNRDYRHPTDNNLSARNYYYPTELFIDRPDLALNIPAGMMKPIIDWQEATP